MYIAVLADNIADRKQTERLLGRANDVLANETGTLYIDSYGDAQSLMRAPMKYELFFLDIYGAEDHGRSVIDALKSANVPGKIALVLPEDIPFSYQNAIEGLLTIQKPLITTTLHQLIKDAHKEQTERHYLAFPGLRQEPYHGLAGAVDSREYRRQSRGDYHRPG